MQIRQKRAKYALRFFGDFIAFFEVLEQLIFQNNVDLFQKIFVCSIFVIFWKKSRKISQKIYINDAPFRTKIGKLTKECQEWCTKSRIFRNLAEICTKTGKGQNMHLMQKTPEICNLHIKYAFAYDRQP